MLDHEHAHAVEELKSMVASLRVVVDRIDRKTDAIEAEIGPTLPAPERRGKRKTLQERLHTVESNNHTFEALGESLIKGLGEVSGIAADLKRERDEAKVTQAALATAQAAQQQANERAWSRRSKIGLFAFAAIGAAGTIVSIAILFVDRLPT